MGQEFVPKEDLLTAQQAKRAAEDNSRRLMKENDELKRDARRQAEDKLTAELISRYSRAFPEFGPGYDGLAEAELPDGSGKVQLNVSDQEPGVVHLRVWGPPEERDDGYPPSGYESFRASFKLSLEGVEVKSLDFRQRFR